jgi:hypothetical protein
MLAGFEILPAKAQERIVDELPDLNFVLDVPQQKVDDEDVAMAWDRELSSRLLA